MYCQCVSLGCIGIKALGFFGSSQLFEAAANIVTAAVFSRLFCIGALVLSMGVSPPFIGGSFFFDSLGTGLCFVLRLASILCFWDVLPFGRLTVNVLKLPLWSYVFSAAKTEGGIT